MQGTVASWKSFPGFVLMICFEKKKIACKHFFLLCPIINLQIPRIEFDYF